MPEGKDRVLHVAGHEFLLDPQQVSGLFETGLVYECGEDHDLHIDPSHRHAVSLERVLVAIRGYGRGGLMASIGETVQQTEDGKRG